MSDKLASLVDSKSDFEDYLNSSNAGEVLFDLVKKLEQERPDDFITFSVSYLELKRATLVEKKSEASEEEGMDTDEAADEIPIQYRNRRRRGAVSSEPNSEVQAENVTLESNPKDKLTNEKLNNALANHVLCSHLDDDERQEVFDHMGEAKFNAGDYVIKQGDDGDKFYVVDEGELECFINTPSGERKKVQHICKGGSFGELALIYNTPRAADVVAQTDVSLWSIDRVTYRSVLMNSTIRKRKLYEEFLDKVPILDPLQKYERLVVADALEPISFAQDEVIVKQGEFGDVFYIIVEGEAQVTQTDREGKEKHLIDLHTSDYFGEIALLTDRPRAATVVSKSSPLRCVRLDRARFNRVLGPCEDILRRNMESYNKYMAKQI